MSVPVYLLLLLAVMPTPAHNPMVRPHYLRNIVATNERIPAKALEDKGQFLQNDYIFGFLMAVILLALINGFGWIWKMKRAADDNVHSTDVLLEPCAMCSARGKDLVQEACEKRRAQEACEKNLVQEACEKNLVQETCEKDLVQEAFEKDLVQEACEKDLLQKACEKNLVQEACEEDLEQEECEKDLLQQANKNNLLLEACKLLEQAIEQINYMSYQQDRQKFQIQLLEEDLRQAVALQLVAEVEKFELEIKLEEAREEWLQKVLH